MIATCSMSSSFSLVSKCNERRLVSIAALDRKMLAFYGWLCGLRKNARTSSTCTYSFSNPLVGKRIDKVVLSSITKLIMQ
jgi:hypothetical protein